MVKHRRTKVVALREAELNVQSRSGTGNGGANPSSEIRGPRRFPMVTTPPRFPATIPDELLDYYGWVFCQGGFANLQMTFEQFLAVVAVLAPIDLFSDHDGKAEAIDYAPTN